MDVLQTLLTRFKSKDAILLPPAGEQIIAPFRMTLARNKIPQPAPDYFKFLAFTDGLIFNGLKIFGTQTHQREEKNYAFPSLLEINMNFLARNRSHDFVILGEINEDLIIYHIKEKNYQLIDKTDLVSEISFPRFYDILYYFIEEFSKGSLP